MCPRRLWSVVAPVDLVRKMPAGRWDFPVVSTAVVAIKWAAASMRLPAANNAAPVDALVVSVFPADTSLRYGTGTMEAGA